jgi:hypothetical protein
MKGQINNMTSRPEVPTKKTSFIIKLFTFKTSILIFDQTVLTLSRIDFEFEFFLTQLLFEKNKTHISQDF